MKNFPIVTVLLLLSSSALPGQQPSAKPSTSQKPATTKTVGQVAPEIKEEVLTNETIIALVKAGLDEDVIVAKIRISKTNFDISSDALQALAKSGVSKPIMQTMMNSKEEVVPEPETIGVVYYLDSISRTLIPLERQLPHGSKKNFFGILKDPRIWIGLGTGPLPMEVTGGKAPLRLQANRKHEFVLQVGPRGDPTQCELWAFIVEKDKRKILLVDRGEKAESEALRFVSSKEPLPVHVSRFGQHSYKLYCAARLLRKASR